MPARLDPTPGATFGHWTVIGPDPKGNGKRWQVRCKCGTKASRLHRTLREGTSTCCTRCASGGTGWYISERGRLPVPGVDIPPAPQCKTCGSAMETTLNRSHKRGWNWRCKPCQSAVTKRRYESSTDYRSQLRDNAVKRKCAQYGLTTEQAVEMWEQQERGCKLCLKPLPSPGECKTETKGTHIDHCHVSGKVRGILCSRCNHAIGLFEDDAARLLRAAAYLTDHSPSSLKARSV